MNPLIKRLQMPPFKLPLSEGELELPYQTLMKQIRELNSDFYRKITPFHHVLNLEYNLLGEELIANIQNKQAIDETVKEQLTAASVLAELLKKLYQDYLIMPAKLHTLSQHQEFYVKLLGLSPTAESEEQSFSFSHQVDNLTNSFNLYRLIFIRSKRILDLIATMEIGSKKYQNFVKFIDEYSDPILLHLAWLFCLPRLLVNLFLFMKHTLPGPWMNEEERSLQWPLRLNTQLERRYFELSNDFSTIAMGFINGFVLTGSLAPVSAYLSLAFSVYDIVLSAIRTYIELNRLYDLRKRYELMSKESIPGLFQEKIKEHIRTINKQINFETLRLGSHLMNAVTTFLAMCCSTPLFAAINPLIPLIGSFCLFIISLINFFLTYLINAQRPKELTPQLKFFTTRPNNQLVFPTQKHAPVTKRKLIISPPADYSIEH